MPTTRTPVKIRIPYGHPNIDSVYVKSPGNLEKEFEVFYYMIKKTLNKMSSFEVKFGDIQTEDKGYITRGATIKFFDENRLVLKGMIEEVSYDSDYFCTAKGYASGEAKLLHSTVTRVDYYTTATAVNTIITDAIISGVTALNAGKNDITDTVSVRFEYDNKIKALTDLCKAFNYFWWVSTKSDGGQEEPFDTDYLNVSKTRGSAASAFNFVTGGATQNTQSIDYVEDKTNMVNSVTCLGYGDGVNQLSATQTDGASITTYGTFSKTFVDKSIINQATLQAWADDLISKLKDPIKRITLPVMDVHDPTILECSDLVTVTDTAVGTANYYIVGIRRSYDYTVGESLEYELSNIKEAFEAEVTLDSFESKVSYIEKKAMTPAIYAQGSTVAENLSEKENLDSGTALNMRFYLPADIIRMNKAALSFQIEHFRAYTSASITSAAEASHTHSLTGVTSSANDVVQPFLWNYKEWDVGATSDAGSTPVDTAGALPNSINGTYSGCTIQAKISNRSGASDVYDLYVLNTTKGTTLFSVENQTIPDGAGLIIGGFANSTAVAQGDTLTFRVSEGIVGTAAGGTILGGVEIFATPSSTHTHTFTGESTAGGSSHTHGITMGFAITEDVNASKSTVVTAGVDGAEAAVGTYTADQTNLDLATQLVAAYNATGAGWYNIKFTANKNMRIEANLFLKYFIRSV